VDEAQFRRRIDEHYSMGVLPTRSAESVSGRYGPGVHRQRRPRANGDGQAAIVVTMPVRRGIFSPDGFTTSSMANSLERAVGRGVADGVTENDGARTVSELRSSTTA